MTCTRIIDTNSVEIGDMVAFMIGTIEHAGIVTASTDDFWTVEVATLSGAVAHNIVSDQITDIM